MLIPLNYLIKKYNLDISGISHIGAHVGQEVEIYKENNIDKIYLFEPQKSIFEKLIKNINTNEVFCFNFGLGPENFKTFINTGESNDGESASILRPKLHLDLYPEITFEKKEEIEIKLEEDGSFLFDKKYDYVFIYGIRVEDFHALDYNSLYTLNFSATQQIDKIQRKEKSKLEKVETEVKLLKEQLEIVLSQNKMLLSRLENIESVVN